MSLNDSADFLFIRFCSDNCDLRLRVKLHLFEPSQEIEELKTIRTIFVTCVYSFLQRCVLEASNVRSQLKLQLQCKLSLYKFAAVRANSYTYNLCSKNIQCLSF